MLIFSRLGLAIAGALVLATPAAAENRLFIIANDADGYGIDRCLANGERCGVTVATAYCQSQSFTLAKSFRKIERDEIAGTAHAAEAARASSRSSALGKPRYRSSHSAHFGTFVAAPHGMIGTVEVEFFGEPSIRRSEYTM